MLLSLSAENRLGKIFAAAVRSSKREGRGLIGNYFCLLKFSLSTLLSVDVFLFLFSLFLQVLRAYAA